MGATRSALTGADVQVLAHGQTADQRAAAAHKLCRRIENGVAEHERAAAEEILRLMALDAAELVRRALAVTLRNSPALPRDVALALARDIDVIATPVLSFSPVFTEEDLVEIVRTAGGLKQLAVARRANLSEAVADALARHGCEDAVRTACANDNAAFSECGLKIAVDRFARSEQLTAAMAYRKALPPSISERLVSLVSERARSHLVDHHGVSAEAALEIALGARERATLDLVDQAGRASDLRAFTAHLNRHGRLTPSLLLRALAHGHMSFFEWAAAELAGLPHHRVWLMIHDAGPLGLTAIYDQADLPASLYAAFRAAVDTYHALQLEGAELDLERFQQRMLERFLTQAETGGPDDIDYLLDRMDRLSRDQDIEPPHIMLQRTG